MSRDIIVVDKTNYQEFRLLETLKKHCSSDETRLSMNGVLFEAETRNMIATDGIRIIIVYGKNLPVVSEQLYNLFYEDGTVSIKKSGTIITLEKTDYTFPPYKRVIPDKNQLIMSDMGEFYLDKRFKDIYKGTFSQIVSKIIIAIGQPVNIGFFEDLAEYGSMKLYVNQENNKAFLIESEFFQFIGMPMFE